MQDPESNLPGLIVIRTSESANGRRGRDLKKGQTFLVKKGQAVINTAKSKSAPRRKTACLLLVPKSHSARQDRATTGAGGRADHN